MSDTADWVGKIITVSGKTFNLQRPTVEMVDIADIAHALSLTCRFNGQIPNFYSVAEHSVSVALYLHAVGRPELALEGLFHDASEAYTGDLVKPMKMMPILGPAFEAVEDEISRVIGEAFTLDLAPIPDEVKAADRYIFDWEVKFVRTGMWLGKTPEEAKRVFLEVYESLMKERNEHTTRPATID